MEKTNSKLIKEAYRRYLNSTITTIYEAYTKPSTAKLQAYAYCKKLQEKYNGNYFKIIGYNTFEFSCGFMGEVDGKSVFVYITKSHDKYMIL